MRLVIILLDTHIWIWWVNQDKNLPSSIIQRIDQAERVAISAASLYELLWLVKQRRLELTLEVAAWLQAATTEASIEVLAVTTDIMQTAAMLPAIHGDPLDRMIIATALATSQPLISLDQKFSAYQDLESLLIRQ